jgi:dethiobiotin synthetase
MGQILAITGTGTNIGKTTVSLAILAWAEQAGVNAIWFKPVQCGQTPLPGKELLGGDSEWLGEFLPSSKRFVGLNLLKPASPHFAAESEGKKINIVQLKAQAEALSLQVLSFQKIQSGA